MPLLSPSFQSSVKRNRYFLQTNFNVQIDGLLSYMRVFPMGISTGYLYIPLEKKHCLKIAKKKINTRDNETGKR